MVSSSDAIGNNIRASKCEREHENVAWQAEWRVKFCPVPNPKAHQIHAAPCQAWYPNAQNAKGSIPPFIFCRKGKIHRNPPKHQGNPPQLPTDYLKKL